MAEDSHPRRDERTADEPVVDGAIPSSPEVELRQRTAELELISSVQQALAARLDMQGVYDLVGDRIRELFDAQVVVIRTFDLENGVERWEYAIEKGARHDVPPRPLDGFSHHLLRLEEPLVVNNGFAEFISAFSDETAVEGETPRSAVFVPLVSGDALKGNISLQNVDQESVFTDADVRLLSTLSNSMSVALENARLFDETSRLLAETEQRNAELAVINSVQEGLVAELDMQGIYDLVGDRIRDLFDAQVVIIRTFDHDRLVEHIQYFFEKGKRFEVGERPADGFKQHLMQLAEPLLINTDLSGYLRRFGVSEAAIAGEESRSALFVPLIVGGEVRGNVSLQNVDREHAFSHADVRLLSTLSNSMSVALENARLFDETSRLLAETEQRNAELAVINSVQEGLVAELDMQGIYDLVGDRIRDLFDAQVVGIATFDHDAKTESFKYVFEDGRRHYPEDRPYNPLRQKLIDSRQLILINEDAVGAWERITGSPPYAVPGTSLAKSLLFVPLIVGDTVRGYVSLQNLDREHAFSKAEVRLLSTLSNSMSIALENARLFDETNRLLAETEQRNAELAVINSVQEGLVAELDMQGIYDLVGDRIRDLFDAQVVAIATFDHTAGTEDFKYLFEDGKRYYPDIRKYNKIRQKLIDSRQLILLNRDANEAWVQITGTPLEAVPGTRKSKSMVFVPLMVGDTVRGYVSLQNLDREEAFSSSEVRLLSTLSNSMSVALENARLFDETSRLLAETEQRNAELAVINSVQEGLVAEIDMQGIYDLVGDRIRDIFNAQSVGIFTFEHASDRFVANYVFEEGVRYYPEPRPIDATRRRLIERRELILINEDLPQVVRELTGEPVKVVPGTAPPKSAVYVPMLVGETVRGYVTLQDVDREHAFSESDVRLLSTLTNSMTIALENARLFDETNRLLAETEQRNAELAVINSVQEGLVAEIDMQGIYDLVGDRIRELFDAQAAFIATFDHDAGTEEFRYLFEDGQRFYPEPRPFDSVRQRLIDSRELILINENVPSVFTSLTGRAPEAVPGTVFPKAVLLVPLVVGDSVRGYVSLQNLDRENAFSDADVRLLSTLANSMSIALENARLFDETNRLLAETEQRNAELAVINSVQEGLVAELDMQGIYDLVGDRMRELFDAQGVIIATFDHAAGTEHFQYLHEHGERHYVEPRPFDRVRKRLIDTRELLLINENADEILVAIRGKPREAVPGTRLPKSLLFVPLIVGDMVSGYISLQNLDREHAFSIAEVRLLSTLANGMSVALQNARLFAETQQRAAELDTVNTISRSLVAQLDLDMLVHLVGEQMRATFEADIVYVALLDREAGMIEFPYVYGESLDPLPVGEGLASQILRSGEPLLINADVQGRTQQMGIERIGKEASSYVGVPIFVGNEAIGVISVQSTQEEDVFDADDLRLLSTIASNVGIALQNAQSYQRLNAALDELKRTQAQLVQQEKLASLGALTAGIAHEIKNPLNFVNNFGQLTRELAGELREELRRHPAAFDAVEDILSDLQTNASKIEEHGRRADSIVRSMLQHSRGGTGKREAVDLNDLVEEYVNLAYHGKRAQVSGFNVEISREYDPSVGRIELVPQDFGRVLLNLVGNAFDAVAERTEGRAEDGYVPRVHIATHRHRRNVEISVADNGAGISETVRRRIFEPFFTTKPAGQGTGLGLSMSHEIITQGHGGEITVESHPGRGTTFSVSIPAG